jgi:uncharacterized protein (TIGR00251 family)
MVLNVRVIPKARRIEVTKEGDSLKVRLTQPAFDGRANKQLLEVLSEYLTVKKYRIRIIKGHSSRNKVLKISDEKST